MNMLQLRLLPELLQRSIVSSRADGRKTRQDASPASLLALTGPEKGAQFLAIRKTNPDFLTTTASGFH
jgi:hypothetical protein